MVRLAVILGVALALSACEEEGDGSAFPGNGGDGGAAASGSGAGGTGGRLFMTGGFGGGTGGGATGGACNAELVGVIRDFTDEHPDFEGVLGDDRGIVENDLGSDLKPVYAGTPTTPTTNGQAAFDQWFRDVPGVNQAIPFTIPLGDNGGVLTFEDGDFFPIDDQGLGNQGRAHNYHFTYEIHAEFIFEGGEVFTFTGDDDLFTFINGRLAIDLGGVHGAESATIDLSAEADNLGIVVGGTYPLDFFFAERHTTESNFRIDTSIACFNEVDPPQ
jgi:fibro-slime domain-containing protein